MIYLPLKHNLTFPQFDFVFIDEAQDTNATRREVAKRMLKDYQLLVTKDNTLHEKPSGRLIAVGDRHQAIYGFTGADNDALDILKKEFSAAELPLSTCFRCSKSVIRHAQSIVPHIQPRTGAIEGTVNLKMPEYNFHENLFNQRFPDLPHSAILCRKNAPLISLAFQLLEKQIPCRIEGRDIGQELIKLCKKLDDSSKPSLSLSLRKHLSDQSSKLSPYKLDLLSDKISAITSILQLPSITSVPQLYQQIESVFSDYDPSKPSKLTLSSIHKSKGLEWSTVYLLGRNAWMPSKFATQPWMEEQEQNLIYVAITRAKETLYEITVEE
jgi:superfamily I DNA/RNA helicase